MDLSTTPIFTRARIVALVLIALVLGGLGYYRFEPDPGPASVPAGGKAGDLVLEPCDFQTEAGSYEADCGTLVVPENRADPKSRLIALPVTRVRAQSEHPAEPIFRLEGGPGITNMEFEKASRFADDHDVVLVGYRGIDGSVRLDCPEVESALKHSTDFLGEKSFRAYGDAFRACADRLAGEGVDLAGYGLTQQVDDLEAARVALGYDRIDLLSESAGTRTAMIYSWRYPESIHRSVMIGANPPGHFLWDGETTDEQIRRYAELCSQDDTCGARTDDLAASMKRTIAEIPDRWFFLPIKDSNVRIASFYGLAESSSEAAPISGPMTLESWLAAAGGDASGFWLQSILADVAFPEAFVWGQMAAAARLDAQAATDSFSSGTRTPDSNLGDAAAAFVWGGGRLTDGWPAAPGEGEYSQVRTSEVETLLIGGALDFATPPQVATKDLLPYLPNGRQVVLSGFGHTTSFWTEQPAAGSRLINTFFASGEVDDSLYEPQGVDFTPEVTQTVLAKGVAGAMVGLALLTVLSLLWMPLRVRWRGQLGRKASALLRSLYPIVLGLGGWFVGVLIVMMTMPGIPLDDELLAVVAVGVPIGLGIYWAWVHRDWSAKTKAVGFAAAMGGALVGAVLGFHVADGLVALVTTVAAAAAVTNLSLIVFDIERERSRRDRLAAATSPPALPSAAAGGYPYPQTPALPIVRRSAGCDAQIMRREGVTEMGTSLSTEGLARVSARHPWITVGAWLAALVIAGFVAVTMLGDVLTSEADFANDPESKQAAALIEERIGAGDETDEIVIVRSATLTVDDPAFESRVAELTAAGAATGLIADGSTYFETGDESLVSADRHATMIPLVLTDAADDDVEPLIDVVRSADGTDGYEVGIIGVFSSDADFQRVADEDLKKGELFGIAAALVILVLVFGAFVASLVPVLLAIVSIAVAVGLTALVGQAFSLSFFVVNMITMMGLAVGIDYSLFVVSRFREERARGLDKVDAIAKAGGTASRAVFFSGLTVVLALLGMLLVPQTIFRSLAVGAILVVLVSVTAALTLLPAVLSLLGDRVNALRIPFVSRRVRDVEPTRGFWPRVAAFVMRRPGISLAAGATILMLAAVPYFNLNTGASGISTLPDGFESKRGFLMLEHDFSAGELTPTDVVIDGDASSPGVQAGIDRLETALATDDRFGQPELLVSDAGDLAVVSVPVYGEPTGDRATESVRELRSTIVPEAFAGVDAHVLVGGDTAENIDWIDQTNAYMPIVFAFVLGLSFILLTVAFRSIVVPAVAILMNLLSVGAAYGLMVLVFQKGFGNGFFGFQQLDVIEAWIPLFLFSVLFGLSMDYHVFLLSRIRERFDQTGSTVESVAFGVGSTSRLITGAALIMVAVFGGFAAGQLVMFQQMGFGLAVAVLIDATIVRSVLVPATMKLLGRWNWYLPSWLGWLPRISIEARPAVEPAGR